MLADEVFGWLSRLPGWQQDLARRLSQQIDLTEGEYSAAFAMVRAQFGLPVPDAPEPTPLRRQHLAESHVGGEVALLEVGGLHGVGLVSESEVLTFGASGLTIVYGQNGAGKSTYVRVLKKLCRTVDRDCELRPNIYRATAGVPPEVAIKISVAGVIDERTTPLDPAPGAQIPGMSVFDSACAELYVDSQNEIQYIPGELRLLTRLASLQDRMRDDLARERSRLQRQQPPLDAYPPETSVGRFLRVLPPRGIAEGILRSLANLRDDESSRLIELRHVMAAAQSSTAKADAAAAKREAREADDLVSQVKGLAQRVNQTSLDRLQQAARVHQLARQARDLANEAFQQDAPEVGGEPWRLMWDAARRFVQAGEGTWPIEAEDRCPLCQQSVTPEVAQRMAHFERHVTSTLQTTLDAKTFALQEWLESVAPTHADSVQALPLVAALREREPELGSAVDALIVALRADLERATEFPIAASATEVDASQVVNQILAWGASRSAHAETLMAADISDNLPSMRREVSEMEARERLSTELPVFMDWLATTEIISSIDALRTALATNKITAAQRGLIEEGVATALDEALRTELRRLSCNLPVRMTTQIAKAETSVGLRLLASDPPRVSEIASEGERRALALCFFLAELAVADDKGGIVLDDPVSSLDDERRSYIAGRLVQEASRRQVVVFTHDLPFVFELRSLAKDHGFEPHVQHIWRQGDDVGRVDQHPPFKTMNLRQRVTRLTEEANKMRQTRPSDNDEAWRQVEGFYSRVRTTWERAVEERLFGGVVERFERDVRTRQFRYVTVTPERIRTVEGAMTRASRFMHEDAYAAQVPLPSIAELLSDVATLREFEEDTRPTN